LPKRENTFIHGNFNQMLLIWHDIARKFHPNIFDLAWHCMGVLCKILLIWHDIAWEFHPNTFDLPWHCTWNSSKYFDAWYCMWISSKYFGSWHCMWNIIHILWPQWHCMCFSNGHCELLSAICKIFKCIYIYFPSYLGV
jgi:hypothetical protein